MSFHSYLYRIVHQINNAMHILHISLFLIFQSFYACNPIAETPQSNLNHTSHQSEQLVVSNIIFQSNDGGQNWKDISDGLPENMNGDDVFVHENELYLCTGKNMYFGKLNSKAPFWKQEACLLENGNLAPSRNGLLAFNYEGQFLQRMSPSSLWLPVYTNFKQKNVRTIFETAVGTVFIGSDGGLFRSTDSGKTWTNVQNQGWVMKFVESDGVLIATSQQGIIRSTDDGMNWQQVINEGGVGIAIERINGGFAAITYNTTSKTRRVRTSYDGGKTWQAIDAGLRGHDLIASIKEVGEFFFCGHPDGIFRSADKGKTWKLILSPIGKKVFNLSVAGNVIYAIPRDGGC
jgi:photosystem II stability/assembly factor-like uncharacterized protein